MQKLRDEIKGLKEKLKKLNAAYNALKQQFALLKARDDQEKLNKAMEAIKLLTEKAEQMKTQLNGVVEETNNKIQGYELIFNSNKKDIDEYEEEEEDDDDNDDDGEINDVGEIDL